MKKIIIFLFLVNISFGFIGCNKSTGDMSSSSISTTSISTSGNSGSTSQAGVITAGEWNDLENWSFWKTLFQKQDSSNITSNWGFYNRQRISVNVLNSNSQPAVDIVIKLKQGSITLYAAKTDNKGNAELWANLFTNNQTDFSTLSLDINNGVTQINSPKQFEQGVNQIMLPTTIVKSNVIDIAFVVDATGSMGDELNYLKTELYEVINRAKNSNPTYTLNTAAVFYRDATDTYLTKTSNFTNNTASTINFIKDQNADGGGDFPEAVHSALIEATSNLQWSSNATSRIIFLILDAPPHREQSVINSLHNSIAKASEKGIKIIPITASGIDLETEFLMRYFAASTNGTYVFITNNSGIGNNHLTPTVGSYQVEYLNNLMVRLIEKYIN